MRRIKEIREFLDENEGGLSEEGRENKEKEIKKIQKEKWREGVEKKSFELKIKVVWARKEDMRKKKTQRDKEIQNQIEKKKLKNPYIANIP